MSGVPPTFVHLNRAACTGHSCAYWRGHRSMWPWKSTLRVVRASTTRPVGVMGANQCQGSPKHLCIPTAPRALAIRARTGVAIEACGHRSPRTGSVVRPRSDQRAPWVQVKLNGLPNICASQPRRVHWPIVRVLGWTWKYVTIEVHTSGSACVHDTTSGRGGCEPISKFPSTFVHPKCAACNGHSCAYWGGHRRMRP